MGKNINELMNRLKITMAGESYPVLKNLKYFRDYNEYINNSINNERAILDDNHNYVENEPKKLSLELLSYYSEVKKYNVFVNIMRVSLLSSLCAFIEMVITTSCLAYDADKSYTNHKRKYKKGKSSTVHIAKDFLLSKGFSELNNLPNWEYIFDMMKIRNRFVHEDGKSNKNMVKMSSTYDFTVVEGKIVLGNDFIENYISIVEDFSVSYAELLYTDESYTKKLMDKLGFDKGQLATALNALYNSRD